MSNLMNAVFSMLVGVVNRDGDVQTAISIIAGQMADIAEFVGKVEEALFRAELEIFHRWEPTASGLNLRLWTDADLGVVNGIISPFIDGCSLTYIGPEADRHSMESFANDELWLIDWDGDTFSKWGWVSLSPVPKLEWDGADEPDYEKMGMGY